MPIIIFLLFTLFTTTISLNHDHHHHRRHLLHQPFFPVPTTVPPPSLPPLPSSSPLTSPSPSPQPQPHKQRQLPKYPFSTTPPNNPQKQFFPSYPSPPPPPPPPTILSTFPANISSLLFPHSPSSSSHRHVVILAVSLSLFSAAVVAAVAAIFLYFRHKQSHQNISSKSSTVSDSQRLFPPNLPPSDGAHKNPAAQRHVSSSNQPSTSSEFLYLGTLVNSRSQEIPGDTRNAGAKIGIGVSPSAYQKLGSPELKPLPPLPKHNPSCTSGEMCFSKGEDDVKSTTEEAEEEEEEEQFFSPRGSSGHKESREIPTLFDPTPGRIGSSSRRENFGSRSFNSRTASYPYSNSCSPSNSITSSCQSPARNLSPNFMKPNVNNNLSTCSSSLSSRSDSGSTRISPDRVSSSSRKSKQSPTRFVPVKLPPPPPPLPPARFWEVPKVARPSSGVPVLVAPPRPVMVKSLGPNLANEQLMKNENVEKSEETPKPKLKPLHWDKVRASSDRAMVWDQLKSSSFQ